MTTATVSYAHPEDLNTRFRAMRGATLPAWAVEFRDDHLIAEVKAYAMARYEKRGQCWDYVIECLSDSCIQNMLGRARTVDGALRAVYRQYVRPMQIHHSNSSW